MCLIKIIGMGARGRLVDNLNLVCGNSVNVLEITVLRVEEVDQFGGWGGGKLGPLGGSFPCAPPPPR